MKGLKLFLAVTTVALLSACGNNTGEIVKKSGQTTLYKKGKDTTLTDSTRLWDKKITYQYKDCEGNLKTGHVYRPGSWVVKTHEFKLRGDSVRVDSGCISTIPMPPKKGYRERVVDNATGSNGFWAAVGTILAILLGLALIIGFVIVLFWFLRELWYAIDRRRRPDSTHVTQTILPAPSPTPTASNEQPVPPPAAVVNHYHFYGSPIINEGAGTINVTDNSKTTENRNGGSGTFNNGTLT